MEKIVHFPVGEVLRLSGRPGGCYWVMEGEDPQGSLETEIGAVPPGQPRVIIPISSMPALAQLLQRIYLTEMTRDMYE